MTTDALDWAVLHIATIDDRTGRAFKAYELASLLLSPALGAQPAVLQQRIRDLAEQLDDDANHIWSQRQIEGAA